MHRARLEGRGKESLIKLIKLRNDTQLKRRTPRLSNNCNNSAVNSCKVFYYEIISQLVSLNLSHFHCIRTCSRLLTSFSGKQEMSSM